MLLARALLNKPDLLVLDEPAQGVDTGQVALYDLINQLRTELNCAVLMVSHDLHLVWQKQIKYFALTAIFAVLARQTLFQTTLSL